MKRPELSCSIRPEAQSGIVPRLRHWWRLRDGTQSYLKGATDLPDLERRQRVLERASGGPAFAIFNN
jgi:hypothetical protein